MREAQWSEKSTDAELSACAPLAPHTSHTCAPWGLLNALQGRHPEASPSRALLGEHRSGHPRAQPGAPELMARPSVSPASVRPEVPWPHLIPTATPDQKHP